ncbi:hypothetical protein KQI65_09780 [bacterium]|nr:hypothetical protein [bacterium]
MSGYLLERKDISPARAAASSDWLKLSAVPIKPWSYRQWAIQLSKLGSWSTIAFLRLYDDSLKLYNEVKAAEKDDDVDRSPLEDYKFLLLAANVDPLTAEAVGMRFVDHHVVRGRKYLYRVMALTATGGESLDTASIGITIDDCSPGPAPVGLAAEGGEQSGVFSWVQPTDHPYPYYEIARSDDSGSTYALLEMSPLLVPETETGPGSKLQFEDMNLRNGQTYFYRIRGLTRLGMYGEASVVELRPRDCTPPVPPTILRLEKQEDGAVRIVWDASADSARDARAWSIERSGLRDTVFQLITEQDLPRTDTLYIDLHPDIAKPYYRIAARDSSGNTSYSDPALLVVADSIPPSPPTDFRGSIDSTGLLELQWTRSPEPDVAGYRILWSNAPTHEQAALTPELVAGECYKDTLDLSFITRSKYYDIVALDYHGNISSPAGTIQIQLPDRLSPEMAIFTNVDVADSSVILEWLPSEAEDVASQYLYRSSDMVREPVLLAKLPADTAVFTDRQVAQGVRYSYQLIALDSSGNVSDTAYTIAFPYTSGICRGVTAFSAVYDSVHHAVRVTWKYEPNRDEKFWFVLYRDADGSGLTEYRSVPASKREYIDVSFVDAHEYTYTVKVSAEGGTESALSRQVIVPVPIKATNSSGDLE